MRFSRHDGHGRALLLHQNVRNMRHAAQASRHGLDGGLHELHGLVLHKHDVNVKSTLRFVDLMWWQLNDVIIDVMFEGANMYK